jgi:hypothetical protein
VALCGRCLRLAAMTRWRFRARGEASKRRVEAEYLCGDYWHRRPGRGFSHKLIDFRR